jgi:hypothetical protein
MKSWFELVFYLIGWGFLLAALMTVPRGTPFYVKLLIVGIICINALILIKR